MTDPNATYKQSFRELTELLGRPPTPRDKGWLEITETYRRAWGPAEETVKAPRVMRASDTALALIRSGMPSAQARELAPDQPLTNARSDTSPVPALSEPREVPSPSRPSEPLIGSRGPGGGMYARCRGCGVVWERERKRGRPALVCRDCAK